MSSRVAIKNFVGSVCCSIKRVVLVSVGLLIFMTSHLGTSFAGGLGIPKFPVFEYVDHEPTRLEGYLRSKIARNIQLNGKFERFALVNGIFDRKNYPFIGADIFVDGEIRYTSETTLLYTDEEGNPHYRVDNYQQVSPFPGDYFELTWKKEDTNEVMAAVKFELTSLDFINGAYNACWTYTFDGDSPETWCGNRYEDYWFWFASYGLQCLDEGKYNMELTQNGELKSVEPFSPSEYQPTTPTLVLSKESILPQTVAAPNGETVTIMAVLNDDIVRGDLAGEDGKSCGVPIKNKNVTIASTINPKTGSHKHFDKLEEIGTGKFISSMTPWDSVTYKPTVITLPTNEVGAVVAEYQSGVYGVGEKIEVKVESKSTGQDLKAEANIDIKVPDLVPLETDGYSYTLLGSYASSCDKQHNDEATGANRHSHYLTQNTKNLLHALNGRFYKQTGLHLSINDASLSYGGFFDDGTGVRQVGCHVSHQAGVDFDVNTGKRWWVDKNTGELVARTKDNKDQVVEVHPDCIDAYGYNLNCQVPYGDLGMPSPRKEILDRLAKTVGLEKIIEDTLHYRSKF